MESSGKQPMMVGKLRLIITEQNFRDLVAGKSINGIRIGGFEFEIGIDPTLDHETMTRAIAVALGASSRTSDADKSGFTAGP